MYYTYKCIKKKTSTFTLEYFYASIKVHEKMRLQNSICFAQDSICYDYAINIFYYANHAE